MISFLKKLDWPLLILVVSIVGVGLLTLYGIGPRAHDFFYRQIFILAIGLGAVFLFSNIDYRIFKNSSFIVVLFYIFSLFLLVTVLQFSPIRAVRSWIVVHTFQFEPSEIAKLAIIILLAKYFSQKHTEIYRVRHVVASFLYTAIPSSLVFIQPDLGSAFVFFGIWFIILLAAGVRRQHVVGILIIAILSVSVGWIAVLQPYQKNRIVSFLNPFLDPRGLGYSTIQSKVAIGSGSIIGKGWGKGTQSKEGFLPEAHTDFIFASFAEQFGLLGVAGLMSLVFMLIWRIAYICRRANNNFSKLFGVGFISLLGIHILLNIGINLGLLPVTGLPFSFLSYGGSHLSILMIGIGITQSIKINSVYN